MINVLDDRNKLPYSTGHSLISQEKCNRYCELSCLYSAQSSEKYCGYLVNSNVRIAKVSANTIYFNFSSSFYAVLIKHYMQWTKDSLFSLDPNNNCLAEQWLEGHYLIKTGPNNLCACSATIHVIFCLDRAFSAWCKIVFWIPFTYISRHLHIRNDSRRWDCTRLNLTACIKSVHFIISLVSTLECSFWALIKLT